MPSSVDREAFQTQIHLLCAGFNVPVTPERMEAYWVGLAKMPMPAVVRVVEYALGPDGSEKIPTAGQLWTLYRKLRKPATADRPAARAPQAQPQFDPIGAFANRALLAWLMRHGAAAGSPPTNWDEGEPPAGNLAALVAEKNRVAANFRLIAQEEPITADELREALFTAFARIHKPMPHADVEAHRASWLKHRGLHTAEPQQKAAA